MATNGDSKVSAAGGDGEQTLAGDSNKIARKDLLSQPSYLKVERTFWIPEAQAIKSLREAQENCEEWEGDVLIEVEEPISNHVIANALRLSNGDTKAVAELLGVDNDALQEHTFRSNEIKKVMRDIEDDKNKYEFEGFSIALCVIISIIFILNRLYIFWTGEISVSVKMLLSVIILYFVGGACCLSIRAVRRSLNRNPL
jgi:hypothetical protein